MHELADDGGTVLGQLAGPPGGDHPAFGEQIAAICHRGNLVHIVRHHDAGDAQRVVHLSNQSDHHSHGNGIQARERLVINQQIRVHHNGPGQRHPPGHPAGQFRRHERSGTAQPHGVQLGQHHMANETIGQVGVLAQRKRHVFEDAVVREQGAVLKQHADVAPHLVKLCSGAAMHMVTVD